MRVRIIRPAFFDDETMADLSPHARLLILGLWCLADRAGRLDDRPRYIRAKVFPYECDLDVEALLSELEQNQLIIRYEINGERFIQVTNFDAYQAPNLREPESVIPPPPSTPIPEPTDASTDELNTPTSTEPEHTCMHVHDHADTSLAMTSHVEHSEPTALHVHARAPHVHDHAPPRSRGEIPMQIAQNGHQPKAPPAAQQGDVANLATPPRTPPGVNTHTCVSNNLASNLALTGVNGGFVLHAPMARKPGLTGQACIRARAREDLAPAWSDLEALMPVHASEASMTRGKLPGPRPCEQLTVSDLLPEPGEAATETQLAGLDERNERAPRRRRGGAAGRSGSGVAVDEAMRQELFVALVECCYGRPYGEVKLTRNERGRLNAAIKQLCEIGATADEVRTRAAHYWQRFPTMPLTPQALVSNWTLCAQPPPDPRLATGQPGRTVHVPKHWTNWHMAMEAVRRCEQEAQPAAEERLGGGSTGRV